VNLESHEAAYSMLLPCTFMKTCISENEVFGEMFLARRVVRMREHGAYKHLLLVVLESIC
jgi:hypothetical protein